MARVKLSRREAERGDLPALCLRCGAPASGFDSKKFSWHPQWVFALILFGLLPFIIVALILTKHMNVRAPFCAMHANHWTKRSWITGGTLVAMIVLAIASFALVVSESVPQNIVGLVCGGWCLLALVWLVTAFALQLTSIETREITDTHITLIRVDDSFLEALGLQREEQQHMRGAADPVAAPAGGSGVSCLLLLVLGGSFLAIVALAAIGTVGKNAAPQFAPLPPPPALAEIVESADHFRLTAFGADWELLHRSEAQQINKLAAAGARSRNGEFLALVLVEPAPPDLLIEGREEDFARSMIRQSPIENKQTEYIAPIDFQGLKAVRYRYTGITSQQAAMRFDNTIFIARGKVFQLYGAGPIQKTAVDGTTFQPFLNAFQLLPEEPGPRK